MRHSSAAKTVRLYYGFQIFFNLLLWLPVFYEYQRAMGLSDGDIFSIQSAYYLMFCFLEIPTGFLADRWGRRQVLLLAAVCLVLANLVPIFFTRYAGFLTHFFLIALARSLESGTSSAYLYEFLKSSGRSSEYKRVEGNARAYELLGKLIGWAGIGAAIKWHATLPYWLTVLCALASLLFAASLPKLETAVSVGDRRLEPGSPQMTANAVAALAKSLGPVFKSLNRSPWLVLVMVQGIGIFALGHIAQVELYQPLLRSKSFDLVSYGWLMSVMTLSEAAGSARPHWLRPALTDLESVFALTVAMALALFGIAWSGKVGTLVGLVFFAYAMGLAYPIQKQLLNDAISDSSSRATLLSIESIVDRAAYAGLLPAMAYFVATGRVGVFLHIAAVATVVFMGVLYVMMRMRGQAIAEPA